jgi:hypothetical protein
MADSPVRNSAAIRFPHRGPGRSIGCRNSGLPFLLSSPAKLIPPGHSVGYHPRLRLPVACGHWLSGRRQPKAPSLAKLRRFLDSEAKRSAQGDGIRPVEPVPYKIIKPVQQVRYARICPFCRKARGKIRKLGTASFQGVCPKCGATGPKRESHQESLRAWNGRE